MPPANTPLGRSSGLGTIKATHSGWGRFGEPSGAPVFIMGMTHAYMVDGRITMEWIAIDEVAIWKQILGHASTA